MTLVKETAPADVSGTEGVHLTTDTYLKL